MRFACIVSEPKLVRRALTGTLRFVLGLTLLIPTTGGFAAASSDDLPGHALGDRAVRARLYVAGKSAAGQSTEAIVELTPAVGWHVYGPEHGDAGAPPEIAWQLPHGIRAGTIRFPPSRRVYAHRLTTYEYFGRTLLRVSLTASEPVTVSRRVPIRAHVTWFACSNVCVPGSTTLSGALDIAPPASGGSVRASDRK